LSAVETNDVEEQLAAISEVVAMARDRDVSLWLRGGWAMDFFLGRITRAHADIDWFVLADEGARLATVLMERGFRDVGRVPAEQQIDLIRHRVEHSFAFIRLSGDGEALVAAGPWAGEPYPVGMLSGPIGRIGAVAVPVIAPVAQIEIKEMMPTWNPRLRRRQQDIDDIAAIRSKLRETEGRRGSPPVQ
jgi:hypothetical protein